MRVLIVEDNPLSRQLLQEYLKPFGTCDVASDGEEAVAAFKSAWARMDPYDLILLDVMMPRMDGNETLKAIRTLELEMGVSKESCVKVIIVTVLSDRQTVITALRSKCEAYLVKPVSRPKLLKELAAIGLFDGPSPA